MNIQSVRYARKILRIRFLFRGVRNHTMGIRHPIRFRFTGVKMTDVRLNTRAYYRILLPHISTTLRKLSKTTLMKSALQNRALFPAGKQQFGGKTG